MTSGMRAGAHGVFAIIALGYLVFMFKSGQPPTHKNLIRTEFAGVLESDPAQVVTVEIMRSGQKQVIERYADSWREVGSLKILSPSQAAVLDRAITFMHTASPVRIIRPEEFASALGDPYGINRPAIVVQLSSVDGIVLSAKFGNRAPDGILQYMQREGRAEIYLMSGFVGETWDQVATQ